MTKSMTRIPGAEWPLALVLVMGLTGLGLLFNAGVFFYLEQDTTALAQFYSPVSDPFLGAVRDVGELLSAALLDPKYHDAIAHPVHEQEAHDMSPGTFRTRACDLPSYHDGHQASTGCTPPTKCGRILFDHFASKAECDQLRGLVDTAFRATGGGAGGPSIVDFVGGAVSHHDGFVDVYRATHIHQQKLMKKGMSKPEAMAEAALSPAALRTYQRLVQRVEQSVRQFFKIDPQRKLYLAKPSFFSKMIGNVSAVTLNDEYWHDHIDQEQYGSFVYTTLVYLNNHRSDFTGGRFRFTDDVKINTDHERARGHRVVRHLYVRPEKGRMLAFTSGAENVHGVEQVESGVRYAVTIAFACDGALPSSVDVATLLQERIADLEEEQGVVHREEKKEEEEQEPSTTKA